MVGVPGSDIHCFSAMADIESQLAATLSEAADEVAHVECLDGEQRSEVYTILEAMRGDTETHLAMVDMLAQKLAGSGEVANA